MQDPWNPSASEIEEWAFNKKVVEPTQDWMMALCWKREEKLYLDLASNNECPKRKYFLKLLYFIVGDAVRSDYTTNEQLIISGFVDRGRSYNHPDIVKWVIRSAELMAKPSMFQYGNWCGGKLASK